MERPVKFLEEYCTFGEDRVYLLMAVAREKENSEITSSSEVVLREVVKSQEDIRRTVAQLQSVATNYRPRSVDSLTFRLYVTANARNSLKTYFSFQERMHDLIRDRIYGQEDAAQKFKQIDGTWKSELQKPKSRDETRFIFDLDDRTEIEAERFLTDLAAHVDVDYEIETPNGLHVVTEPFNYNEFETDVECELKTDGLLFLKLIDTTE